VGQAVGQVVAEFVTQPMCKECRTREQSFRVRTLRLTPNLIIALSTELPSLLHLWDYINESLVPLLHLVLSSTDSDESAKGFFLSKAIALLHAQLFSLLSPPLLSHNSDDLSSSSVSSSPSFLSSSEEVLSNLLKDHRTFSTTFSSITDEPLLHGSSFVFPLCPSSRLLIADR